MTGGLERRFSLFVQELFAEVFGEIDDEVEVVDGGEVWTKDFAGPEKMGDIGLGVLPRYVAG